MNNKKDNLILPKAESWRMFDEISPKYDLLNHLLSLNLDVHWRRCLAKYLPNKTNIKLLDLATGTADVILTLIKMNKNITKAVGLDLSEKMMKIGRIKIEKQGLQNMAELISGDASQIPHSVSKVDAVTMAFGIRNTVDPTVVLKEIHRVLEPNGKAIILEFSLPQNIILRRLHLFYLRTIVPFIGNLFSGNYQAYKYLNQTIETFPYGNDFCNLMLMAGFSSAKANPLMGGIATIYVGDKR